MIPVSLLSKAGVYDLTSDGANIKVRVVDNPDYISTCIDTLKSKLAITFVVINSPPRRTHPIVGINLFTAKRRRFPHHVLTLCLGSYCFIFKLEMVSDATKPLLEFLADKNILFLNPKMDDKIKIWHSFIGSEYKYRMTSGVDIGVFAAKYLNNPELCYKGISEVAAAVGLDVKEPKDVSGLYQEEIPLVFSAEEVKEIVASAYYSWLIGDKLVTDK